jgi:hypothetical protein
MGISIRHILVDDNDDLLLLSNRLFERLWNKSPEDLLPQSSLAAACVGLKQLW